MKLSICLTVALTALSVAAAPSFGSPVYLEERGKFGAAASLAKAIGSKVHHVRLPKHGGPHKPPRKPSHPAPHKPGRRPSVRLPSHNQPKPRPAPPPPSNSDAFSGLDGMFNDVASQNEPHFSLGSILRRNRDYDQW